MTDFPLTLTTFLPLVGAGLILFLRAEALARWVALVTTLATLAVSIPLYTGFDKASGALQHVETAEWIPAWNVEYSMGVDGISLPFVFLASLLSILCVGVSWKAVQTRVREFYAALLLAETAMIGLFAASNLLLFYVFWELMIVPMFLLIGVWGGPGRVFAAVKFLIFTLAGSVLMLVAMVFLHQACDTLDFRGLVQARDALAPGHQIWLFAAFLAAFAVKVPMFPVHTWLPNAHTEAPTAGSVILAGILLKMGAYGFLRISLPILPHGVEVFLEPLLVLSAVAIVYGAYVTLVQTDVKRLIAFSSVSHMGFVTLGIFTLDQAGIEGAILQMINHGILSGALFLCVGVIYDRLHTREISRYGGLVHRMPVYAAVFMVFVLGSVGLPGTSGFVGEFLVLVGAFQASTLVAVLATTGIILGAAYMLYLYRRVVFGKLTKEDLMSMLDLSPREIAIFAPLIVVTLWMGIWPEPFLDVMDASVTRLVEDHQVALRALAETNFAGR